MLRPKLVFYWPTSFRAISLLLFLLLLLLLSPFFPFCFTSLRDTASLILPRYRKSRGTSHYTTCFYYYYHYFTSYVFFTLALADGLSRESERQQVSLCLEDSISEFWPIIFIIGEIFSLVSLLFYPSHFFLPYFVFHSRQHECSKVNLNILKLYVHLLEIPWNLSSSLFPLVIGFP